MRLSKSLHGPSKWPPNTFCLMSRSFFIFSVVKFLFLLKLDKIVSLTRIFESLDFKKTTWKIFNSLNYNLVDLPKEIKNIYQRYL